MSFRTLLVTLFNCHAISYLWFVLHAILPTSKDHSISNDPQWMTSLPHTGRLRPWLDDPPTPRGYFAAKAPGIFLKQSPAAPKLHQNQAQTS